jgi:hypothetical protein
VYSHNPDTQDKLQGNTLDVVFSISAEKFNVQQTKCLLGAMHFREASETISSTFLNVVHKDLILIAEP